MNLAQVARMLSGFTAFFTLAQIPPLVLALQAPPGDHDPVAGFVASMLVGGAVSGTVTCVLVTRGTTISTDGSTCP